MLKISGVEMGGGEHGPLNLTVHKHNHDLILDKGVLQHRDNQLARSSLGKLGAPRAHQYTTINSLWLTNLSGSLSS